jgi:hypothetical protein
MSIACYKFQALAHSTNQDKSASLQTSGTLIEAKDKCVVLPCNSNKTRRVVTADWICNVGELILSFGIAHVRMTSICDDSACEIHNAHVDSVPRSDCCSWRAYSIYCISGRCSASLQTDGFPSHVIMHLPYIWN